MVPDPCLQGQWVNSTFSVMHKNPLLWKVCLETMCCASTLGLCLTQQQSYASSLHSALIPSRLALKVGLCALAMWLGTSKANCGLRASPNLFFVSETRYILNCCDFQQISKHFCHTALRGRQNLYFGVLTTHVLDSMLAEMSNFWKIGLSLE